MQFKTFLAAVAAIAPALVGAQVSCPEASRFGVVQVSPTTLAPGDNFTVTTNFTCSFTPTYNIFPKFVDYYIEVPVNNNGHEPNILLARTTFAGNASFPVVTINATVPFSFYFPNTTYNVVTNVIYPVNGTDAAGTPYLLVGGVEIPINLTIPANEQL